MTNAALWGNEIRLDSDSGGTIDSAIAGLATGKLASTFTLQPFVSNLTRTHGQIIDAGGLHHGTEFEVDASATGDQTESAVVALSTGGFVAAWEDASTTSLVVRAQIFDSEGHSVGASFSVATGGDLNYLPQLAARPDGGFAAISQVYNSGSGDVEDIVSVFNADGTSASGNFAVNSSRGFQPDVAFLSDGRILAAWESFNDIHARIFNVDGTPAGQEFTINDTHGHRQSNVQLLALRSGGFAAVWQGFDSNDDTDVYAQIYNANGNQSS